MTASRPYVRSDIRWKEMMRFFSGLLERVLSMFSIFTPTSNIRLAFSVYEEEEEEW